MGTGPEATASHDTSWSGSRETARRLGVTVRHVYRLVDEGVLPPPTKLGYRNMWSETDLTVAESRRQSGIRPQRPPDPSRAIERKKDEAELARAFMACWRAAGLSLAVSLVKAEGAEHPGQLQRGQHRRLAQKLWTFSGC